MSSTSSSQADDINRATSPASIIKVDNKIYWPPEEMDTPHSTVRDDKCFIIRYNQHDKELEKKVQQIPYYFGCKYRYILWMYYSNRELCRLKCRKRMLEEFMLKLGEVRAAISSRDTVEVGLPRLPHILDSPEIRRKHHQLRKRLKDLGVLTLVKDPSKRESKSASKGEPKEKSKSLLKSDSRGNVKSGAEARSESGLGCESESPSEDTESVLAPKPERGSKVQAKHRGDQEKVPSDTDSETSPSDRYAKNKRRNPACNAGGKCHRCYTCKE
ncbi:unnamed protein product [Hermetia illucens]|uniref:Uncharacterized protein n=1 Tax=Hermetia illucens TaxID=343691 RepID=A0A7R8UCI7_HERIL|nr:unnamed protein product [Hermetia illucens]